MPYRSYLSVIICVVCCLVSLPVSFPLLRVLHLIATGVLRYFSFVFYDAYRYYRYIHALHAHRLNIYTVQRTLDEYCLCDDVFHPLAVMWLFCVVVCLFFFSFFYQFNISSEMVGHDAHVFCTWAFQMHSILFMIIMINAGLLLSNGIRIGNHNSNRKNMPIFTTQHF